MMHNVEVFKLAKDGKSREPLYMTVAAAPDSAQAIQSMAKSQYGLSKLEALTPRGRTVRMKHQSLLFEAYSIG